MIALFITSLVTVFIAELIGDKTFYTLSALAARFRMWPILAGAAAAFVLKMLCAVLLGRLIAALPIALVTAMSAATFFAMAIALWLKKPKAAPEPPKEERFTHAAPIAFASIFFTEWGDAGQIAAALLVAQHRAPVIIWAGATLAMTIKALIAVTVGMGVRRFVPRETVRLATVVVCVAMGLFAAFRVEI